MTGDLIDLKRDITDAIDLLEQSARLAYELSGADGGRRGDPALGIPDVPATAGDPGLVKLSDDLHDLAGRAGEAFTPTIRAACEAAEDEAWDAPETIRPGDYHLYERRPDPGA